MPTFGTPEWESAILNRLRANDEAALRQLMEAYFDTVANVAFRYVRDPDAARDIAQNVFISVWNHRLTPPTPGKLVHYLRRAARNTALNAIDRDAAAARLASTLTSDSAIFHPYEENRGASEVDVEELRQAVQRAMAKLSPRVREVALLHLEQGLQPGEIAQLLGVAPRTVYNQLRKAMHYLAEALGGWPR